MEETVTKPKHLMMKGTNGGLDYLVFARHGDIALAIKVEQVVNGAKFNMPGTIWFGTRLRSARLKDLPEDAQEGGFESLSNIVQMKKKVPTSIGEAWPEVVWEKIDSARASTVVGIFVNGTPDGSSEDASKFKEATANSKLSRDMATYLMKLAGDASMIITVEELTTYLESIFGPVFMLMEATIKQKAAIHKEMEKSVGFFGMQAALVKKAYAESTVKNKADKPDEDESDDHEED